MKLIKLISGLSIVKVGILGILISLIYFISYFDDGTQLETQITSISSQVDFETSRRVEVDKIIKKEEEMRGNLLQLQRNLEVVKTKIPNEFKDTQMSAILNNASLVSGISLLDLSITSDSSRQQVGQIDPNSVRPEDLIEEVKFNIALLGSYDSLIKFLDVLTKEEKVLKVRNFVIEKNSTNIDDDSIKFKGEIIGFKQSALLVNSAKGVR